MTSGEPIQQTLESLVPALRNGEYSAQALVEAAIVRHEEFGADLCAYFQWDAAGARAAAMKADQALKAGGDPGPLCGIPVSAKDLFGVDGFPTFAGSPSALPDKWNKEGPVVSALKSSGAVFMGKTHMVEFAFGGIGTNPHWDTPRNPWDSDDHRVCGGSSSGAGVSLWEGSAFVALGSDTAGSVRVPASFTGAVGLKTTKHRWSTAGLVPLSTSLDTPGILTKNVADAVIGFSVIDPGSTAPYDALLADMRSRSVSGLRFGLCEAWFEDCDPGIAQGVEAALSLLAKAGATVERVTRPRVEAVVAAAGEIFKRGGLAAPEFAALINDEFGDWKATLDPNVLARFEKMEAIPAVDYISRRNRLTALAAEADEALNGFDAIVGPTVPITAPTLGDVAQPEEYLRLNMAALRNTSIVNLLDLSAVSMPVALDAVGMPIGLQLVGRSGDDAGLLSVALACETVLGTASALLGTPPMVARN
jgi:aspartyl-tRNA(Asn)/glutamyl-tRNA(Gln) amidotransferase subunit A